VSLLVWSIFVASAVLTGVTSTAECDIALSKVSWLVHSVVVASAVLTGVTSTAECSGGVLDVLASERRDESSMASACAARGTDASLRAIRSDKEVAAVGSCGEMRLNLSGGRRGALPGAVGVLERNENIERGFPIVCDDGRALLEDTLKLKLIVALMSHDELQKGRP